MAVLVCGFVPKLKHGQGKLEDCAELGFQVPLDELRSSGLGTR